MLAPRKSGPPTQQGGIQSATGNRSFELPCGVSESALEAFTRMASRGPCCGLPILDKLDSRRRGMPPESILEILGDSGTGKSLILYNYVVDYILPKQFGGLESNIIFIDTSFTLNSLFLSEVLGKRIVAWRKRSHSETSREYNIFIEELIKKALARLHILRADSTTEIASELIDMTIYDGLTGFPNLSSIRAILIDDIATTILQDKAFQPSGGYQMWKAFLQLLKKLSVSCGLSIFYVKNSLSKRYGWCTGTEMMNTNTYALPWEGNASSVDRASEIKRDAKRLEEYLPQEWAESNVTHRILLQKQPYDEANANGYTFLAKLVKPYSTSTGTKAQRHCTFNIDQGLVRVHLER